MLTIIHGDDIVSSRKYFTTLKEKHTGAHSFDGAVVTLTDLAQIFDGGGLFENSKTVFIEQLLTKKSRGGRKSKTSEPTELDAILAYFDQHASLHTIVIWENKEIDRSVLLGFKTAEVKVFKLPQTLFLLLDSIKPGNGKQLVKLFHQTLETTEAEMIFFMLVRQVRLLLALAPFSPHPNPLPAGAREPLLSPSPFKGPDEGGRLLDRGGQGRGEGKNPIDEVKRMQPWQKTKMQKQAAMFTLDELKNLYAKLFEIEIGQKTGSLSMSVRDEIDFLLLEI